MRMSNNLTIPALTIVITFGAITLSNISLDFAVLLALVEVSDSTELKAAVIIYEY